MSLPASRFGFGLAVLACVLLPAACGGGGSSGPAATPSPPMEDARYRASGLTPFVEGCDGVAPSGTLYVNAEVEPFVAVNPRDPDNIVGVWQQDRWSTGGARGLLTGLSLDGGRTWVPRFPAFTRCAGGNAANGGDYERASDPWVTFAPDGTAYQIAIAFNGRTFDAGSANAVLVSRSADGGRSWGSPLTLIRDGGSFFNDKESITADPTDSRLVYAVWDRLALAGGGPTMFARTTDGGLSWEAPRPIYDPGPASQTINNQIVVLRDGTLVDFFTQIDTVDGTARATLAVVRSLDKGVTWSAPRVITPVQALGTRDPETGVRVRDGANLGSIAAGPRGELVVAWQDARFSGGVRDGIAVARSLDGGDSWTTAARVNNEPAVPAFVPAVHVRTDGTIGVSYYDFRSNTDDRGTLPTDYWLAQSSDGQSWTETRVAGPFDLAIAPNSNGLFVGDYQGLTSIGSRFVPFFAQTQGGTPSNRTDVWLSSTGTVEAAAAAPSQGEGVPPSAGRVSALRAKPAESLPVTPELQRRLTESVASTMQRRVPGWTPRGILRPPAPQER